MVLGGRERVRWEKNGSIHCHFQKKLKATNMKENNETSQMFGCFVIIICFHGKSWAKTARLAFFSRLAASSKRSKVLKFLEINPWQSETL